MDILNRNLGVIIEDPRLEDYRFGGITGILEKVVLPSADWSESLPVGERQGGVYMDSMACVSFSAANVIKSQMNYFIANNLVPDRVLNELKDLGFIDENGKFDCSERWIAIVSGTTKEGNSGSRVWEAIREFGLLPQKDLDYPVDQRDPVFDWDDFYSRPSQSLYEKARKTSKYGDLLDIRYEWLSVNKQVTLEKAKEWLKMTPFQVFTPVCAPWDGSIIPACSRKIAHATMIYKADAVFCDFDTYNPFKKRLASDYPIPYAMRGIAYFKEKTQVYDMNLAKQLSGQLLLDVGDRGALWYVDPKTLKRVKIGTSKEEIETFLQAINDKKVSTTGITHIDILKIPTI